MSMVKDDVAAVLAAINHLVGQEVLVGIPASEAERDGSLSNAQLGYIHEYGSPSANIPARPFLEPGVSDQAPSIGNHLEKAARAAMKGDAGRVDAELGAAGMVAQAGARHRITSGEFEPLSPETIRRRRLNRKTKSIRPEERKYLQMIADGKSPAEAQSEAGIRPLINTGQLRNSLTYVVRKKE